MRKFKSVGFCFPRLLHSNHCAVVVVIRVGGKGWLKTYWRKRQKLPLSLPIPIGPKDEDMVAFDTLAAGCVDPKPMRKPGKDWMSVR